MIKVRIISLAERCEQATETDRELDALIWDAVDRPGEGDPDNSLAVHQTIVARMLAGGDDGECPAYTASLDAAMTLMPDRWTTHRYHQGPSGQAHWWQLVGIGPEDQQYSVVAEAKAVSPALALTAASLRALASALNGEG